MPKSDAKFVELDAWRVVFDGWGDVRVLADTFDEAVDLAIAVAAEHWSPHGPPPRDRIIRVVRIPHKKYSVATTVKAVE